MEKPEIESKIKDANEIAIEHGYNPKDYSDRGVVVEAIKAAQRQAIEASVSYIDSLLENTASGIDIELVINSPELKVI